MEIKRAPWMALLVGAAVAAPPLAHAGKCKDESVIEDVWEQYDRLAREMGCASPAKGPGQWLACAAVAPGKKPIKILDQMLGFWNSMAKNKWATIGPRTLGPSWEEGKLVGTTGRTFVAMAPANSGEVTVHVKKTDGKAETEVTVCATRHGEQPRVIWDFRIENGETNRGHDFHKTFTGIDDSVVSINLDAKSVTNTFSYSVKLDAKPIQWDFGPVKGVADLHAHQAAELSSGGTMYYGGHVGPKETALKACGARHGLPFDLDFFDQYNHGEGNPTFGDWPHHLDIGHQQMWEGWLKTAWEKGNLRLIVVSAVNSEPGCKAFMILHPHPGVSCRDMPNLNAQVDAFARFAETHDWYEIAVDPWHARKIIHEGKLAVVISLESSHLFPSDAGDLVHQLDEMFMKGVRALQPTHEVDSRFSGAAPWMDLMEVVQTFKFPVSFNGGFLSTLKSLKPGFDYETKRGADPEKRNSVGMKPDGYRLVDAMVARHMLIDMSHMSTKATEELFAYVAKKHRYYPLHMSHSRFKPLLMADSLKLQQEFVTTDGQLDMVRHTGGMIGLRTGPQPIKPSEDVSDADFARRADQEHHCYGTVRSLANLVDYGRKHRIPVALGTDWNGNTSQMGSRFKQSLTGCMPFKDPARNGDKNPVGVPETDKLPPGVGPEYAERGLRHVGLLPDLLADLRAVDAAAADTLDDSAEQYLQMWERAWNDDRSEVR